jgi:hypothetical protein
MNSILPTSNNGINEIATSSGGIITTEATSVMENPLFTGGAGLMGLGVLLSFGRRLSLIGTSLLKRKFISRLELDNTDE